MEWVLEEVRGPPFEVVDALVELGERGSLEVRAEVAAIAERVAADDQRACARAAVLQPPDERASRARAALAAEPPAWLARAWLAMLPDAELDAAIAPYVDRALRDPDRWEQMLDLLRDIPGPHADAIALASFERRSRESDFEASEVYDVPSRAPEIARRRIACDLAAPTVYTAWRLGWWAELLPEAERAAVVDEALAAFDRIVATPTSPGNDAGPFCDLAPLLDDARVHRALATLDRMAEHPGWTDLDVSRASLAHRLAELGCFAEADALAAAISVRYSHGYALGGIAARRKPWEMHYLADADVAAGFLWAMFAVFTSTPPAEVIVNCRAVAMIADTKYGEDDYASTVERRWQHPLACDPGSFADRVYAQGGDAALVEVARILAERGVQ